MEISKTRNRVAWVLIGLVLIMLTFSASGKLFQMEEVVLLLGDSGFGNYITALGILELMVVVLFLIPKTRAYGTLAIIAYLGGVIAVEIYTANFPLPGILLSVLFWTSLYLRKPQLFRSF